MWVFGLGREITIHMYEYISRCIYVGYDFLFLGNPSIPSRKLVFRLRDIIPLLACFNVC